MENQEPRLGTIAYMLVQRGVKLNRQGNWMFNKGSDDLILWGFAQVEETMTYTRLCDAVNKRRAMLKDECSGYEEGDIMIGKIEIIR